MTLNQPVYDFAHRYSKRFKKSNRTEWAKLIDIDGHLNSGIVGSTEPPVNEFSIG